MQHIQLVFLVIRLYFMCLCPYGHDRHTGKLSEGSFSMDLPTVLLTHVDSILSEILQ